MTNKTTIVYELGHMVFDVDLENILFFWDEL
jgi:hypothetical protein